MRWLAVWFVVVLVAWAEKPADALVVMEPGMAHACPQAKTWDLIEKCLKRQGTAKILRTLKGVRLVGLKQGQGPSEVDAGAYLYLERAGQWWLGGQFESNGSNYELLDFQSVIANKHSGFRIDIGQSSLTGVAQSDGTTALGMLRMHHAMFCSGLGWSCVDISVTCEVLVRGKAVFVFRGTLKVADNVVSVLGDRRYAGPTCASNDRVHLGWVPSIK